MDKKDKIELLSKVLDMIPTAIKYFHNNGKPATKLASNREDLIHVNEVKDAFSSLVADNQKVAMIKGELEAGKVANESVNVSRAIGKINNPDALTNSSLCDEYGLTPEKRRWLLEYIFCVEGGYFNHPNDPGGETMYGIIKTEARANGYNGPMRDLPKEVATEIYLRKYWKKHRLTEIKDFKKALCVFDFLVNSGNRGIKVAQRTVNKIINAKNCLKTTKEQYKNLSPLLVDGVIGDKTIDAINAIDTQQFLYVYMVMQEDTYEDLMRANSKLRVFDEGWENRIVTKALFLTQVPN